MIDEGKKLQANVVRGGLAVLSPFLIKSRISVSDWNTCQTTWMAYVFLLNLGLEDSKQYIREGLEGHVELRTSSSGVKSLTILKSFLISSGVFPLIMLATVLHPTSLHNSVRELSPPSVCCENDAQQGLDVEVVSSQDDLK